MRRGLLILFMLAALIACGRAADPLDALAPGERGRVVRVIDGDALVLETGQSVRLVSIEAPAGPVRERPGEPGYDIAKRMLEDMALGREVELRYAGITRDRYDRALAHAVTADSLGPRLWLNAEMVRRGGARVRVYPDTAEAAGHLLALEQAARAEAAGLWAGRDWAIHQAGALPGRLARFQIIEGTAGGMEASRQPGSVCDILLSGTDFRLEIKRGAAEHCQLPSGSPVRARGFVRDGRMDIVHALNIERLEPARRPD
jgi:micrococcal nuclease